MRKVNLIPPFHFELMHYFAQKKSKASISLCLQGEYEKVLHSYSTHRYSVLNIKSEKNLNLTVFQVMKTYFPYNFRHLVDQMDSHLVNNHSLHTTFQRSKLNIQK